MQVVPPAHVTQEAPPKPQATSLFPGAHVVPVQQPAGHESASQTQAPPTQREPAPHGGPWPH